MKKRTSVENDTFSLSKREFLTSFGVNTQLRVTREDGHPIPNLFAAGEVIRAGATTGNALVNGMMVTPALTFGRLIGQTIAI